MSKLWILEFHRLPRRWAGFKRCWSCGNGGCGAGLGGRLAPAHPRSVLGALSEDTLAGLGWSCWGRVKDERDGGAPWPAGGGDTVHPLVGVQEPPGRTSRARLRGAGSRAVPAGAQSCLGWVLASVTVHADARVLDAVLLAHWLAGPRGSLRPRPTRLQNSSRQAHRIHVCEDSKAWGTCAGFKGTCLAGPGLGAPAGGKAAHPGAPLAQR